MSNWKVEACRKLVTAEKYLASISCVASLYRNESKIEEAINLLNGIIEAKGINCKIEYKILAHYHIAFCYLYSKCYALAAQHFENVLSNRLTLKNLTIEHKNDAGNEEVKEFLVNFDEIYHYIGTAYYNLKLYDMAIAEYEEFINLKMKSAETNRIGNAYFRIALCFFYKGDYNESDACGRKALEHSNSKSLEKDLFDLNGAICYQIHDYDAAIHYYEKLLTKQEKNERYYDIENNLALCYAATPERLSYALHLIDDVMSPENTTLTKENRLTYLDTRGYILYKFGSYSSAIRIFDDILKDTTLTTPTFRADVNFHKGNAHLRKEELDDALTCYNDSSASMESQGYRFDTRISEKRRMDTTTSNESLSRLDNNIGVIFAKQDKKDEAISKFRNAIQKNPSSEVANENLIKVLATNSSQSFPDYWLKSTAKKLIFLSLLGLIFYTTVATFGPNLFYLSSTLFSANSNNTASTSANAINSTTQQAQTAKVKATEVSINNVVVIGILTLILLAPIIRDAKISLQSIEFSISDNKTLAPEYGISD